MKVVRRGLGAALGLVMMGAGCAPAEETELAPVRSASRSKGNPGPSVGELPLPSRGQAPLTGGTLTLLRDGVAAASDPDRSLVAFVDLSQHRVLGVVKLAPGSQPTRSVEDGAGKLQVLLRGTGQVATLSPKTLTLEALEWVCAEPRGITWDALKRRTLIACATGELISRPLEGPSVAMRPGGELRDVMVRGTGVVVSTFRASRLLTVNADGVASPLAAPPRVPFGIFEDAPVAFVPNTAWKTLALPSGAVAMVHQRAVDGDVRSTTELAGPEFVIETTTTYVPRVVTHAYYGSTIVMDSVDHTSERPICTTGVVRSAVTVFSPDGTVRGSHEVLGILPIDAAASPSGLELAVVAAGNHQVTRVNLAAVTSVEGRACGPVQTPAPSRAEDSIGQPTGVTYLPDGALLVHSRRPARLLVLEPDDTVREAFWLPEDGPLETPGHQLFHTAPKAVACASCHPEGGDDGHVWKLPGLVRRTQPLTGGIARTAPYHWSGDRADMVDIVNDTFVNRMGGSPQDENVIADLTAFLDALPARVTSAPVGVEQVNRGKSVFAAAGCGTCHAGPLLTNNASVDVGTRGVFQVPSLVGLGSRAPYMHDGCATTMRERFTKPGCGGTKHGDVSKLSAFELDALVDYLTTL